MAGEALSQRETLTINNGSYYLDTTVSEDTQRNKDKYTTGGATLVNEFRGGQTYFMFFVYAKNGAQIQTYQIYVGDGFDKDADFKPGRMQIESTFEFKAATDKDDGLWAQVISFDKGLLTVRVDFTKSKTELLPTSGNGLCRPRTFCKLNDENPPRCVGKGSGFEANPKFWEQNNKICDLGGEGSRLPAFRLPGLFLHAAQGLHEQRQTGRQELSTATGRLPQDGGGRQQPAGTAAMDDDVRPYGNVAGQCRAQGPREEA